MCMAATVFAGLGKVAWNHWMLRKYEAIAEAKKAHLREMRESRRVIQLQGEGIPFGIRAIEAGIEVEGVHISRPATPSIKHFRNMSNASISSNGTKPGPIQTTAAGRPTSEVVAPSIEQPDATDASSRQHDRSSSTPGPPRLFIPQAVHGAQSAVRPAPGDRSSYQSLSSSNGVGPRYIPRNASHLRFSSQGIVADLETLDRLEGQKEADPQAAENGGPYASPKLGIQIPSASLSIFDPKKISPTSASARRSAQLQQYPRPVRGKKYERSSASSSESASSKDSIPPSQPPRVQFDPSCHENQAEARPPAEGKQELDSLHSHRLSHAAEVGQLLPRARRAANGDRTNAKSSAIAPPKSGDGLVPPAIAPTDNPFATPGVSPVEETAGSKVHPLRNLGEDNSNSSQGRLAKQHGSDASQPLSNPYIPVIRKVNSGFEILAPGTFGIPDIKANGISPSGMDQDLEASERGQRKPRFVEKLRRGRISSFTESI
ncbi:hypothetical protein FGG08_001694 [Glutinoglossum americanum]|uniref:Uncharacterized protein n=1 Tax=Glutinoglossum americanum TaxID=1670608 RepID=A0A9P8IEB6_9PEZI|nr:hypothetical protein FGG08_001694 [Glutinoglossum americanum]